MGLITVYDVYIAFSPASHNIFISQLTNSNPVGTMWSFVVHLPARVDSIYNFIAYNVCWSKVGEPHPVSHLHALGNVEWALQLLATAAANMLVW